MVDITNPWLILSWLIVFFFGRKLTKKAVLKQWISTVDFLIEVRKQARRLYLNYKGTYDHDRERPLDDGAWNRPRT